MDHTNPTFAKIPILDTGKFEQWMFRIQQYLQNEHYALREVIEFGDSYKAPPEETDKGPASESSTKKKGRIVAITTKDMQKRRNDVKARTTLFLALPDEHQLRFSKYETAKELWEAILKTFGGNEATKKIKKNQLKMQYDDLIQKFLTSLALEWLMYTIVWRIRDDLDTMSLDDVYNHLKVYEPEVQKKSESNSQNLAFISSSNTNSGKGEVHTASVPTATAQSNGSQIKYKDITQIDEDDIEEMDIKWNMALLSMRADRWSALIGTKWAILLENAEHLEVKTEERESYKQGPKEEEPAPKALMAIDGIGWNWSYMANEKANHALVADDKDSTEFALMAKSSSSSDKEVYDDSYCSKSCRKNIENLNTKISKLNEELSDCEIDLYNYKRGLSQVEARLVEFTEHDVKYCERIRVLESDVEIRDNKIKYLKNELEQLKKEKESLPKFVDDTVTDYSRPTPSIDASKCNKSELQSSNFFAFEHGESSDSIMSKPMIKYVKEADCPRVIKTNNTEKLGNQLRNMLRCTGTFQKKTWPKDNYAHKSMTPRAVLLKPGTTPIVGNPQNNIDDKGYWDSGCSRHMTGNISYLSEYEPYDGGYVSFGHGGGKITESDYGGATQDKKSTSREHNTDFHQIVDFLEASHIRIETTNQETKILATVDGKPRTISESSLRRHLKLNDEEGISSLPDTELFENLSLMGYNILPNQSLDAGQDRENIAKTSAMSHESSSRVLFLSADEGRRIINIEEELGPEKSTDLGSNDTEEMVNVLSSMEAAYILSSRGVAATVSPADVLLIAGVPNVSGSFPTVSVIFTTASVEQIDAQVARKMEEEFARENQRLSEQLTRDSEIARLHAKKELKIMIEGLDRSNKAIAKHLSEYEQAKADLTVGEKIELIRELVKYQDHRAKILKYQAQQSKALSKKEQREFYMSVLRSHAGWKTKHFRRMTLEQIKEKFIPVWKQFEDFVPISSKEESVRVKRQGLKIDQGSSKRMKISKGASEEELKGMMQLVPLEEVYIEALQVKHPIIDWEIHYEGK
nr:hypothetical protein [Tanacetum cinerariifolium]